MYPCLYNIKKLNGRYSMFWEQNAVVYNNDWRRCVSVGGKKKRERVRKTDGPALAGRRSWK